RFSEKVENLLNQLKDLFVDECSRNIFNIEDEDKIEAARSTIQLKVDELHKEYNDSTFEQMTKNFAMPIKSVVASLSKPDLAAMAKSLVNLTSMKKKLSMGQETVGGPIDVALISKGDGLIWIDRKHYFDQERNPHKVAKYYR
ncbi:hypothetical protein KKH18_13995, partial [bacterium]|nr:hypothetical protein [bacterium]